MALEVTVVGFDIAINVFQVNGVDRHGVAVLRRRRQYQFVTASHQTETAPGG